MGQDNSGELLDDFKLEAPAPPAVKDEEEFLVCQAAHRHFNSERACHTRLLQDSLRSKSASQLPARSALSIKSLINVIDVSETLNE